MKNAFDAQAADFCDTRTARCRISPTRFADLALIVGQWVRLESATASTLCRVWPARYDSKDAVLVDPYICKATSGNVGTHTTEDANSKTILTPLNQPIALAQRITATVQVQHKDPAHTAAELISAFQGASAPLKRNIVQNILMNLALEKGCVVGHPDSSLRLTIVSTIPEDVPVLVNKGTIVSIVSEQGNDILTGTESQPSTTSTTSIPGNTTPTTLPGLEKAFQALLEVVSYPLLYSHYIQALNIECPKGVLLYGPPGVGKTYLVATVAQYCRARMITIHGPEIFGPYVGESEEKLRQKFEQAQRMVTEDAATPVVVFIDELDALTPHRADAAGHESRVVAQLLTLMDGLAHRGRVVVVAATNRPNSIDPALRRPGRFDREVGVDVPGEEARERIMRSLTKDMPLALSEQEIKQLARMTNGYVGADLEALCRESALNAVYRTLEQTNTHSGDDNSSVSLHQQQALKVTMQDFKKAFSHSSPSLQRGYGVMVEPVHWSDIGGLESVKQQLRQAVEWPILYRDTFKRLGLRAPRGILLYGPPGCSKTTLVKAIATTSGASFLSVNGAALYSSYMGDSEKILRQTFHQARLAAPSIIFLDELDTIVGKRNLSSSSGGSGGGGGGSGGDSVQERVLSTMLNEMDGIDNAGAGVLVVGATNRQDLIDKALLRPGRFDRVVYVPPPDVEARLQILKIYTRDIPLATNVNLEALARETELYTGADLQNLCREAAMLALRQRVLLAASAGETQQQQPRTTVVEEEDFEQALRVVKPSLTKALLAEYSNSGTSAF
ncbi:hypothetical protein BGW42_004452 [Actinomortierella wolfii]|nr:hypothetical protein BGW42_004452 [Actinomortierella wolfii]